MASTTPPKQPTSPSTTPTEPEDTSCSGQSLYEYMQNAEIDPTLVVSKPDRSTLIVSRGKPPEVSTNIYRLQKGEQMIPEDRSTEEEEEHASLAVVTAESQRGVISVASNYSMLSFSSVLSDEEDNNLEDDHNNTNTNPKENGYRSATDTNTNNTKQKGIRLPTSGDISNEWRLKLAIAPVAASNSVTRLERQLTEFLEKELRQLRSIAIATENKKTPTISSTITTTPIPKSNTSSMSSLATIHEMNETQLSLLQEDDVNQRLQIYTQAMETFSRSHEMKPYRSLLNEYKSLVDVKLRRVDQYKIQVDELESRLGAVERKAQKRIVAVYKHCNLENEQLKLELHAEKTNIRRDEVLAKARAKVAEEELADEIQSKRAMEVQRKRLMHVHDVLLKYFQKHALWKSDGEDPNELSKLPSSNKTSKSSKQTKTAVPETTNENNKTEPSIEPLSDEDVALQKSLAAADAIHEAQAEHEHEQAEWKQIHLAMQAMTDSHMAALNDLTELSSEHRFQLEELREKIISLEKDKAELIKQKGPGPTPLPEELLGETNGSGGGGGGGANGGDLQQTMKGMRKSRGKSISAVPSPPKFTKRKESNFGASYQRRLLLTEDPYEGLAPIVVEILQRRPLPALDADAVIIKPRKISNIRSASKSNNGKKTPRPPNKKRHLRLHSHNPNSSYLNQQRAHNPHGVNSPRLVSRLHKAVD